MEKAKDLKAVGKSVEKLNLNSNSSGMFPSLSLCVEI